jgi:pimeloyl-ACP methyl ester carboxylesterase
VPRTLVLASAYAGWGGSLPAEVAAQRLQQAMVLAELTPEELVATLLPTMFTEATPSHTVEAFGASMLGFHPAGFRAMARASAENLRDTLPGIQVPTLLVCGANDVRSPLPSPRTSTPPSPARPWSSSPTPATSATSRPQPRSTRQSGTSSRPVSAC